MVYFILVIYMTKLYVIRHCETDGNKNRIYQGHINLDVNEMGEKQLQALEKNFESIAISRVYTSPLIRAKKTAAAIAGKKNIPIIEEEGLIELCGGVYEGLTYQKIGELYPEFKEIWTVRPWDFAPENGESMASAYNRIWECVLKIVRENPNQTLAAITHGAVLRCLNCRLLENDIKLMNRVPFGDNTGVSLLEFDDALNCKLIYFNNSDHLTDDLKNPNAKIPVIK